MNSSRASRSSPNTLALRTINPRSDSMIHALANVGAPHPNWAPSSVMMPKFADVSASTGGKGSKSPPTMSTTVAVPNRVSAVPTSVAVKSMTSPAAMKSAVVSIGLPRGSETGVNT